MPREWQCPKCNNLNYSFRQECNRCKLPRGADPSSMPWLRAQDWRCRFCNNLNYAFRDMCNRCKVPKSQGDITSSPPLEASAPISQSLPPTSMPRPPGDDRNHDGFVQPTGTYERSQSWSSPHRPTFAQAMVHNGFGQPQHDPDMLGSTPPESSPIPIQRSRPMDMPGSSRGKTSRLQIYKNMSTEEEWVGSDQSMHTIAHSWHGSEFLTSTGFTSGSVATTTLASDWQCRYCGWSNSSFDSTCAGCQVDRISF